MQKDSIDTHEMLCLFTGVILTPTLHAFLTPQNTEVFPQLLASLAAHLPTEPAMPSLALNNGGSEGTSTAAICAGANKAVVEAFPGSSSTNTTTTRSTTTTTTTKTTTRNSKKA